MQLTQSRIQSNSAGQGTISFPEPTCLLVSSKTRVIAGVPEIKRLNNEGTKK